MSKITYDNPFSASTQDDSTFKVGTATVESDNLFSSVTIGESTQPIVFTIDPDLIENITDLVLLDVEIGVFDEAIYSETLIFESTKLLSDVSIPSESIALTYSTSFSDTQGSTDSTTLDTIKGLTSTTDGFAEQLVFDVDKQLDDYIISNEIISFDISKPLYDSYSTSDKIALGIGYTFFDVDPFAFSESVVLDTNKALTDSIISQSDLSLNFSTITNDSLLTSEVNVWSMHKDVNSYAVAEDLITVPDGLEFTIFKTKRNFAIPFDTFNKTVLYNRSVNEELIAQESISNTITKNSSDELTAIDLPSLSIEPKVIDTVDNVQDTLLPFYIGKGLFETAISSEIISVELVPGAKYDIQTAIDLPAITFTPNTVNDSVIALSDLTHIDTVLGREELIIVGDNSLIFDSTKLLLETQIVSDPIYINLSRPFSDSTASTDFSALTPLLSYRDNQSQTDNINIFEFNKSLFEDINAVDPLSIDVIKQLSDNVVTEDLLSSSDGSTYSLVKHKSDSVAATDVITFGNTNTYFETVSTISAGSVRNQNYVDNSVYFYEDYVGDGRTF